MSIKMTLRLQGVKNGVITYSNNPIVPIFSMSDLISPVGMSLTCGKIRSRPEFNHLLEDFGGSPGNPYISDQKMIDLCITGLTLRLSSDTCRDDMRLFRKNVEYALDLAKRHTTRFLSEISVTESQLDKLIWGLDNDHKFVFIRRILESLKNDLSATKVPPTRQYLFLKLVVLLAVIPDVSNGELLTDIPLFGKLVLVNNAIKVTKRTPVSELCGLLDYMLESVFDKDGILEYPNDFDEKITVILLFLIYSLIIIFKRFDIRSEDLKLISGCLQAYVRRSNS